MSDKVKGTVQRVDGVFTEELLKANDGKKVPLTASPGGPVIGEATLTYHPHEKALKAEFTVDDSKMAEFLKGPKPSIFEVEGDH